MTLENYTTHAELSACQTYRYLLRRSWSQGEGTCLFVMLNPSTADATMDDPTARKCVNYAARWGYQTLEVVNLYALRSPDPKAVRTAGSKAVGPDNDLYIKTYAQTAQRIVAAWGTHDKFYRAAPVLRILRTFSDVYCLRRTLEGHPEHPLYLPTSLDPVLYQAKREIEP